MSNKNRESPEEILKRIEAESADRKRQRTMDLLTQQGQQTKTSKWQLWLGATWDRIRGAATNSRKQLIKASRIK